MFWTGGGGEHDLSLAERMHEQFDRLASVKAHARTPDDLVSRDLLAQIDSTLNDVVFTTIRTLRHKTIARAADAFSRQQMDAAKSGLSFMEVDRAAQILLSVRQAMQAGVLFGSWRAGAVPVPQQNQFEFLDLPFVSGAKIVDLQTFWTDHAEARDKWLDDGYRTLMEGGKL